MRRVAYASQFLDPTIVLTAAGTARAEAAPGREVAAANVCFWALSGHPVRQSECPLSGAKRTLTSRCLPISIYEYTA